MKKVIDLFIATVSLILLSPVFCICCILVKLTSRGPIFYVSDRIGVENTHFNMIKFRTMRVDTPQLATHLMTNPENFLTPVGSFLRKTSLDELPQLFNIIKGDMSVVGNRPLPLYEAKNLTADESVERFLAPSGLTGLWQVKNRGLKEINADERIQLDKVYARKCSMLFDLKLIVKTFPKIIQKESV